MSRLTSFWLVVLASSQMVHAEDFTLRNAQGQEFGPFLFVRGTELKLDGATYSIASVTNTPEQVLQRRMQSIVIPEMIFSNTPIREVVDFLRVAAKKYDPAGEGVNIVLSTSSAGFANNVPRDLVSNKTATVTFSAWRVTLFEALAIAAETAGFRFVLNPNAVLVLHSEAPDGELCRRMYSVLPSFRATIDEMDMPERRQPETNSSALPEANLEATFRAFGMDWPVGSSIRHIPKLGKVIVVNTERNLRQFERVLGMLNLIPFQVKTEFFYVAFPTAMVSRVDSGRPFASDDALKLWQEGKGRPMATLAIMTKSSSEATTKSTMEEICPTLYRTCSHMKEEPAMPTTGPFVPSDFETREVGYILSVLPEVSYDRQQIDLLVTPQFVEDPSRTDFTAFLFSSNTPSSTVECRQPLFAGHTVNTSVAIKPGATMVIGGGWPLRRTPEVAYLIVTADLIDLEGNVLPSPDLNAILPDSL